MTTTRKVRCWEILLLLLSTVSISRSEANVALLKPAEQSSESTVRWVASKVVDGCTKTTIRSNCCTHTRGDQTQAWWRVDMDYYQHRFAGYQLYLSNTTESPTQGVLCYEDKSSTQAQVQLLVTHQCPYVARYVTVYNYRHNPKRYSWYDDFAILMLCEVQVFGCPVRSYGDGDCYSQCSGNCYGGNCNSTTGSCFYCFPGKYGDYCNNDCSTKCKDSICERGTGYCFACDPGFYGNSCNQKCSRNCKDKTCVQGNGFCKDCEGGFFGPECNPCSTGCANPTCNKSFGNCSRCNSGLHGNNCDRSCPANCKDQLCIQNSGDCTGCDPGYHGSDCYQTCSANCANQTCDQNTGLCTECIKGKYSGVCNLDCSDNCKDKSCMKDNGYCLECVNGKYGDACDLDCSDNCKDKSCWKENGYCPECTPGKYGPYCSSDCPGRCKDNSCQQIDGVCNVSSQPDSFNNTAAGIGVAFGVIIMALVIVVILLIRRSSRNKGEDRRLTHITNVSESVRQSDLQKNSDGTYHGTGSHTMTQPIQSNRIDGHYEQLDPLKREPANVYETTKTVHKEDGSLYSNI
ncbi:scavenger receptor class F member 2-like isoform X2 [Mizuhopecten yessoensis]|uniref:scavenger receptor class F member 2-like isoform X2 n=1 Tax=Mizuhopecten yessoensis TaxID=6573 RepID=UPI000B45CF54|nr:scavenger receptor class F member 2-like isoform X2 [Mizuhopecten yessoensis]